MVKDLQKNVQLEQSNYINKTINEPELEDGSKISEPKDILNLMKDFYKNLYSEKPRENSLEFAMQFLDISNLPHVPDGC